MRKVKQELTAKWEIIEAAEFVESLGRNPTEQELNQLYQGQFVPLLHEHRVDRKQIWSITIVTTAKADDGYIHTHEVTWNFDKPMSMAEVLRGAKHIKVNDKDGIKVRWTGVAKNWLKEVDSDLEGMTAMSAWATATCTALVEQRNPAASLLAGLIKHVGAVA